MNDGAYPAEFRSAVLTRTWSSQEASEVVALLRAYGIEAWAQGDAAQEAWKLGLDVLAEVEVIVTERDLEDAASIFAEHASTMFDGRGGRG